MSNLVHEAETYAIRGAIFEVYKELGSGFLEAVYQESLELELTTRQIPFIPHPELLVTYKSHQLRQTYRPDLLCYNTIIVELKSAKDIIAEHRAQMLNYLKATGLRVGLLVNFGTPAEVQIERFVL